MRVTSQSIYNTLLAGIRNQMQTQSQGTEQISSGRRFSRPSEDGVAYTTSLNIRHAQSGIEASLNAISTTKLRLGVSSNALNDIVPIMQRAEFLATQQANGTFSASERQTASIEVAALQNQLLALANSTFEGEALFAGTATDVQAIQLNASGDAIYQGNTQDRTVAITPTQSTVSNVRADHSAFTQAFSSIKALKGSLAANGQVNTEQRQMATALVTGAGTPATSATLLQDLTDGASGSLGVLANDTISISGTNRTGGAVSATFTVADPATDTVADLLADIELAFGAQVTASMDGNGNVTITDNQAGESSLSFSLTANNEGAGSLGFGAETVVQEGRSTIQATIDLVTSATNAMAALNAEVGSRLTSLAIRENTFMGMETQMQIQLSQHESVDMAEVAIRLSQSETALQVAYAEVVKFNSLSLVNFLR